MALVKILHIPHCLFSKAPINTVGEPVKIISNSNISNGTFQNLHINHYIFKSYEEYLIKKTKGDALSTRTLRFKNDKKDWERAYIQFNRNEIKNDPIMDKYIPLVKQAISKRFTETT